jgi:DNA primase
MAMQRDDLERVRDATDLVELVGSYVALRKAGKNYKGLCPFHQEKTPSFIVFPETQTFHCFGCGAGGDAIGFLMRAENLSFREALERPAGRAGITLTPSRPRDADLESRLLRLAELNALAAAWFSHVLWNTAHGEPGRRLLEQRGVDRDTAERFQLGFAPESWDALLGHLIRQGATPDELVEAGLAGRRDDGSLYDRFRYRLMFPIRDRDGRVIGFGARALGDAQPKYLNTPQTPLFDKGASLYAIDLALEHIRRTREVIVVEGSMDAIAAHQFGRSTASSWRSTPTLPARRLPCAGWTCCASRSPSRNARRPIPSSSSASSAPCESTCGSLACLRARTPTS